MTNLIKYKYKYNEYSLISMREDLIYQNLDELNRNK